MAVGTSRAIDAGGTSILICRTADGFRVVRNFCPHQSQPMDGARVRGETIICPHHGARFRLDNGISLTPDLVRKSLAILPCVTAHDHILVGND